MKNFLFTLTITALGAMGCTTNETVNLNEKEQFNIVENTQQNIQNNNMVTIKIGNSEFCSILYDNDTTKELIKQFPATYTMSELHGNEKYYYMPEALPTNSERPNTINKGDIMLYGTNCIVLFYDTFANAYNYTKLGYIEDTTGLEKSVGKGNINISFELK